MMATDQLQQSRSSIGAQAKPAGTRSMLSALLASQNNHPNSDLPPSSLDKTEITVVKGVSEGLDSISEGSKIYDRTTKVAKTGYSDHGDHGVEIEESTVSDCNDDDDEEEEEVELYATKARGLGMTPQKRASPGFRVKDSNSHSHTHSEEQPQPSLSSSTGGSHSSTSSPPAKPTSLLHAALIGSAPNSAKKKEHVRGACLTAPSQPVSNDGADNVEGNLITYVNDFIKVPNRNVINHSASPKPIIKNDDPLGITTLQVISLLGQGTFAQVFKCKNTETGDECAVKIVKNKPAYTRQAAMEIEVFKTMSKDSLQIDPLELDGEEADSRRVDAKDYMVSLLCYFVYKDHLCLVFELLGQNLYELLKRRQFRGLPISKVRSLVKQAMTGVTELSQRKIVHCDLKPENILVVSDEETQSMVESETVDKKQSSDMKVSAKGGGQDQAENDKTIKLIDFGSACFEGSSGFTYIQSRFYRSPEVLVGVNYDSAIDMWSLGCVAAELFLGLPILPGVHELDQLGRIQEMIGDVPEWMLNQGKKASKYYSFDDKLPSKPACWRLKTKEEFSKSLSPEELQKYGGMSKLEQPPANRYFKYKMLRDIVIHHGNCKTADEKNSLILFVHFLKGLLNPDPCERWTAYQASTHPFLTGKPVKHHGKMKSENDINWSPPWDAAVCRRKLSLKQGSLKKSRRSSRDALQLEKRPIHIHSPNTLRVMDMTDAMRISHTDHGEISPPDDLHKNYNNMHGRHHLSVQYQPSTSMSALEAQHDIQARGQLYHSSLSASLRHADTNGSLPPPPSHLNINNMDHSQHNPNMMGMMGPQSFSGIYHTAGMGQVIPQGDLGYALQRPGVVPGGGLPPNVMQQQQQHQINPIYMQQIPQSQMGGLVQASSYTDMGPMSPGSYSSGLHAQLTSHGAMSMPSVHQGPIPQDLYNNQSQIPPYRMQYPDADLYNDYSKSRRHFYRGSSM